MMLYVQYSHYGSLSAAVSQSPYLSGLFLERKHFFLDEQYPLLRCQSHSGTWLSLGLHREVDALTSPAKHT